jgi:hypothetical protein
MLVLQHLRGGLNFLAGFSPAASLPALPAGFTATNTPYCMYVQAVHKSVAVCYKSNCDSHGICMACCCAADTTTLLDRSSAVTRINLQEHVRHA